MVAQRRRPRRRGRGPRAAAVSVGFGRARRRRGRRSRTAAAGRSGRGSSCRRRRRRRTSSAGGPGPRRRRASSAIDHRARAHVGARLAQGVEVVRRVEQDGGQQAAGRAADEERPSGCPCPCRPPARRARAAACPAGPRRCRRPAGPRSWTRIVPGLSRVPVAANASPPLADDPRDGGQRLDVVDDGGAVEQAALRRVGRPLLGLAALALERLEQHRLLAQHVGALDGPDGDGDAVCRSPTTSSPSEARLLGRGDRALEPRDERRCRRRGPRGSPRSPRWRTRRSRGPR